MLSRSTRTRVKSTGIIDLNQVLTNFIVYAINGLCQILQQFSRDLKTETAAMTDSTLGVCHGAVEQLILTILERVMKFFEQKPLMTCAFPVQDRSIFFML